MIPPPTIGVHADESDYSVGSVVSGWQLIVVDDGSMMGPNSCEGG